MGAGERCLPISTVRAAIKCAFTTNTASQPVLTYSAVFTTHRRTPECACHHSHEARKVIQTKITPLLTPLALLGPNQKPTKRKCV